jgi:hypothetical protein
MQQDLKSIKERAARIGLPHRVWSRLASTPDSKIYEQNLSNWLCGDKTSDSKVKRLMAALVSVEDLVVSVVVRPDLSDADVVRLALQRLQEKREQKSHVAEVGWTPRAAVVRDFESLKEDSLNAVKNILATPLEK